MMDRWPNIGARIAYVRKTARTGSLQSESGIGVVKLIGGGCEPMICLVDGSHVFPTLGDTWEVLQEKGGDNE